MDSGSTSQNIDLIITNRSHALTGALHHMMDASMMCRNVHQVLPQISASIPLLASGNLLVSTKKTHTSHQFIIIAMHLLVYMSRQGTMILENFCVARSLSMVQRSVSCRTDQNLTNQAVRHLSLLCLLRKFHCPVEIKVVLLRIHPLALNQCTDIACHDECCANHLGKRARPETRGAIRHTAPTRVVCRAPA